MLDARTFILLDPHNTYGSAILRRASERWNVRGIALCTNPRLQSLVQPDFPEVDELQHPASTSTSIDEVRARAKELAQRWETVAVAPYFEHHIELLAPVVGDLGLSWNSAEALCRSRNKHQLKQHLDRHGVDVPVTLDVGDLGTARAARAALHRFVLKPNAGHSNRNVGFFDARSSDTELTRHLASSNDWVAEEYVAGDEYSVNGQVDEHGAVHVVAIILVERVTANGREAVYRREWSIPTTDPAFGVLTEYATQVMRTMELKSIPFHLEIRLSERGPLLIDIGARPVGNEIAFILGRLHDDRFNALHLAIDGYLGEPCAPASLDWEFYDAHTFVRVYGRATRRQMVARLGGFDEVSSLPAFVDWARQPEIGDVLEPTLDLDTFPYAADLITPDGIVHAQQLSEHVEAAVTWNQPHPSFVEQLRARSINVARRVRRRLRWWSDSRRQDR